MTRAHLRNIVNEKTGWLALLVFAILISFAALSRPSSAQSSTDAPRWWPGAASLAQIPECQKMFEIFKAAWNSDSDYNGSGHNACSATVFTGNPEIIKSRQGNYDATFSITTNPPFQKEASEWRKDYNFLAISVAAITVKDRGQEVNFGAIGSGFDNMQEIVVGWTPRPLVRNDPSLCPAGLAIAKDMARTIDPRQETNGAFVYNCRVNGRETTFDGKLILRLYFDVAFPRRRTSGAPKLVQTDACTTDLLKGPWRAENAALAKTGHAVTFTVLTGGAANHDGTQKRYRGEFTTYPAHKRLLGLAPTPMFTSNKAYVAGKDLCLIPMVITMRDSGVSRSAALIDTKNAALRFVNDQAYRFKSGTYQIYMDQLDAQAVSGAPGRWLRGAAPALAKTCTPADFNGRWDRSDGARVTIRGAGTQGVGGTGSMDDHPENWVRGQNKYTSMRMKSACVYTAKCYASQRTTINGRPDFKMVETACELVIDPETKTLRERGTSNSYSYTKAGAGAAARKPPLAATPPEPAQPSQAVQALNSEQAAAAKREIQAYEARKKAIADEQAAKEAAYRKALADREALIGENNRRAAEARAKWEASAAACRAGDKSQCAPKP